MATMDNAVTAWYNEVSLTKYLKSGMLIPKTKMHNLLKLVVVIENTVY